MRERNGQTRVGHIKSAMKVKRPLRLGLGLELATCLAALMAPGSLLSWGRLLPLFVSQFLQLERGVYNVSKCRLLLSPDQHLFNARDQNNHKT